MNKKEMSKEHTEAVVRLFRIFFFEKYLKMEEITKAIEIIFKEEGIENY